MVLPKLPYTFNKRQRQAISFKGINRSEQYEDGQLRDSFGLSSGLFPTLTQSKPFKEIEGYEDVSDIFEWNDKLLVVSGNMLYYDNAPICNVSPGKKQFAVVNTKLCIFPDKVIVDLTDSSVLNMDEEMSLDPAKVNLRGDTITAEATKQKVKRGITETFSTVSFGDFYPYYSIYTYGNDPAIVSNCYKNGKWEGLGEYEQLRTVCYPHNGVPELAVGEVFIPKIINGVSLAFAAVTARYHKNEYPAAPDRSKQNEDGYYAVVTKVERAYNYDATVTYDVYKADGANVIFSSNFEVGDALTFGGTQFGLKDFEKGIVESIDPIRNSVTFNANTVRDVAGYYQVPTMIPSGKVAFRYNNIFAATIPSAIKAGSIVFVGTVPTAQETTAAELYVWDSGRKAIVQTIPATVTPNNDDEYINNVKIENMAAYTIGNATLTLKRTIPDLEYICESENRLWGVSNKDNTIYASELGVPSRFFTYNELSTGSYAVAVGSEDKFTAICSYGGGVCCFKEKKLHKVLGSYPAEYYMHEYEIAGVQQGSEKSLQIINEVLFYKGVHGVYAYSGGTPQLISYEFGQTSYKNAVATTDGKMYYIGMSSQNGANELLTYDIAHGAWMCELKSDISALCFVGDKVHLASGGKISAQDEDISSADWSAEFVPMDEDLWSKKGYSSITLKVEMQKGAHFSVAVKENSGQFNKIYTKTALTDLVAIVPLRIGRCDRFAVKIEGKGQVTLRGILREFAEGRL